MIERLRSPGGTRALVWASALVLIAGVVAFVTVRLGHEDKGSANVGTVPSGFNSEDFDPNATITTPKESDVPKAARIAAGEFVLAAVGRENLPKAWKLADAGLKRDCACSYKEWLTGNIPVQFFPTKGLRGASFSVDEVTPRPRRAAGAAHAGRIQRPQADGVLHRPQAARKGRPVAGGLLGSGRRDPGAGGSPGLTLPVR